MPQTRWIRIAYRVVTVGSLLGLFAGCGDLSFIAPREPTTVRFVYSGDAAYYQPLIEEFQQKNKYITIEMVSPTVMRAGRLEDADVLVVPQFAMTYFLDEDFAIDLNTFATVDSDFSFDDFYPTSVQLLSTEGQQWGVPYMADLMVMAYNRSTFDRHGVGYPDLNWTWNDFLEIAQKLSDPARGEYAYANYQSGQLSMYEPMIFMYGQGGRLFDDLAEPTEMTINDPANITAMQGYADLIYRYHVTPPPGQRRVPYPQAGVEGGKYAMWMSWLSDIDSWGDDLDIGIAPIPAGQIPVTMGTVYGLVISSQAEDPDACWTWVKYLSTKAPPALMPLRRSLVVSNDGGSTIGVEAAEVGRVSLPRMIGMNFSMQGQLGSQWGVAMQAFNAALVAIQGGDAVGPALDTAQSKLNP
jgi:ABC-type glycerol-3-phosphate transport system substrate-binding protein